MTAKEENARLHAESVAIAKLSGISCLPRSFVNCRARDLDDFA
jgi:hypothetical protein